MKFYDLCDTREKTRWSKVAFQLSDLKTYEQKRKEAGGIAKETELCKICYFRQRKHNAKNSKKTCLTYAYTCSVLHYPHHYLCILHIIWQDKRQQKKIQWVATEGLHRCLLTYTV